MSSCCAINFGCAVLLLYLQICEYYRRHSAAHVVDANEEYEALLKEEPLIEFSGEVSLLYINLHCHIII